MSCSGAAINSRHNALHAIRLVQLTDTHLFGDPRQNLRGVATLPALNAVLACAAPQIEMAEAVLVTGDVVQDDAGGYGHFVAALDQLGKPVLCVPGNHDDVELMRQALARAPFQFCGHADFGDWRIVLLDSVKPGEAGGHLSRAELARLEQSLKTAANRHTLVCLHHHPVSMRSRWLDSVGLDNAAEFFEIIDKHANVRAISWGHVHQSFDETRNGVRLLATPSTCTQFMPLVEDFAIDTQPPGYRMLELGPDGSLRTEVLWLDHFAPSSQSGSQHPSSSVA